MMSQILEINVKSMFLDEQSIPEENIYLWAYYIKIKNIYTNSIKIKRRICSVVDSIGQKKVIEGIGILGEQPIIKPGKNFEYASGVLLNQPSGFFEGKYYVECEENKIFEVTIPSFSLDSPYQNVISQ